MSPFRSIMTYSLLACARAFKFQPLGPVSLGSLIDVRWTSSPGDPQNITLSATCNDAPSFILVRSTDTALLSYSFAIPSWITPSFLSELTCNLTAAAANDTTLLLDTIPIPPLDDSTITSQTPAVTSGASASTSMISTSKPPIGAIIGGVIGGMTGLGVLAILLILRFRQRRRRSFFPPTPTPLPYDQNYVQPLDSKSRLAQITDERQAVQQQRDQLQTEMDRMHLRDGAHSATSDIPPSDSGVCLENRIGTLNQRIFELEARREELERQLDEDRPPPSYSNLSPVLS